MRINVSKAALAFLLVILVAFTVAILFAFPVMLIWNYAMTEVFGLPMITFWQAFWLAILSRLLFGTTESSSK